MTTKATKRQETVEQPTTETTNALAEAATEKTRKRAKWEHFRFAACPGTNRVNVCNVSHGVQAKADHTYSVRLQNGTPVECGCPADEYQPGPCKHRVALADAPDVIEAAGTEEPRDYTDVSEPTRFEQPDMGGGETTGVVDLE